MGYTVTQNHSEFDRGVAAGEIAGRLAGLERHLSEVGGSVGRVTSELQALKLQMQHLDDAAAADRATVLSTAAALKEASEARREQGETRWLPLTRLSLLAGIALAAVGVIAFILSRVH